MRRVEVPSARGISQLVYDGGGGKHLQGANFLPTKRLELNDTGFF
jgi:hypothetical protein